MMKRRGAHPHSCHFVPRLEQLEDRTVLSVAPVIVLSAPASSATQTYVEIDAYPLAALAKSDTAAAYGASGATRAYFDNVLTNQAVSFVGRLASTPGAQ